MKAILIAIIVFSVSTSRADTPATKPAYDLDALATAKGMQDAQLRMREQVDRTRGEIKANQDALRKASDRLDVSPQRLEQVMAGWDDQKDTLEIDVDAADARMGALQAAVDETAEQAQKSAATDEAVTELNKVVASQKQALAQLIEQQRAALVSPAQVLQAQADLAQAQAQVAVQRERVIAANGGDTIAALKKEMIDLRIDGQEHQARLNLLHERRDRMSHVLGNLRDLEDEEASLKAQQAELEAATARLDHFRQSNGLPD